MFELCKYLDTLRNKSNNTIDSKFLIRIVRLGKNDKHINELNDSDLKYFLNLKEFSSEYEWENIDSILESFNENWKKRQSIQNQLEEHLINGSYKLADDYYLKHLGGLIYNTQYKPLKTRCISKCDFMIALRNLEFENAEVLFYKQCNSDLVDIFEKKYLEAIHNVLCQVDKLIENNNWNDAEKLFNNNIKYTKCDTFADYIKKFDYLLDSLINTTIEETNKNSREINFEKMFIQDYPNINFKYVEKRYIPLIHTWFENSFNMLNVDDSIAFLNKFYEHLKNVDYIMIYKKNFISSLPVQFNNSKLLDALKCYMVILKPAIIQYDDFIAITKDVITKKYPDVKYNFPISYKKLLELYLIDLFIRDQSDDAKLIYQYNKEYFSLEEYNNLKKIVITKIIDTLLPQLPESYKLIFELYKKNIDILNEKFLDEVQEKYKKAIEEQQKAIEEQQNRIAIKSCINKLRKLSEAFIGINEQSDIRNRLLSELKDWYKVQPAFFNDSMINEINKLKSSMESVNSKKMFPNIEFGVPSTIDNSVFYHKTEFFIASFVRYNSHLDKSHFIVKPYKGQEISVQAIDLITIGSLIKDTSYHSHCYKCRQPIDGGIQLKCPECNWYICSKCDSCGCGYGKMGY